MPIFWNYTLWNRVPKPMEHWGSFDHILNTRAPLQIQKHIILIFLWTFWHIPEKLICSNFLIMILSSEQHVHSYIGRSIVKYYTGILCHQRTNKKKKMPWVIKRRNRYTIWRINLKSHVFSFWFFETRNW